MTDRELLELAAKAAGINGFVSPEQWGGNRFLVNGIRQGESVTYSYIWNPLNDDGDALRLAVNLGLPVLTHGDQIPFDYAKVYSSKEHHGTDPYAATRRAIVRAAAEIGKEMK